MDGLESVAPFTISALGPQIKAKPASDDDAKGLSGLVKYLYGNGEKERLGIVRWGPVEMYLTLRVPNDPNPGYGLLLHA